jgi:hypothetical protein
MLVGQFGIIAVGTTVDAAPDVTGHRPSAILSPWKIFDPTDNRPERDHRALNFGADIPVSTNMVPSVRSKMAVSHKHPPAVLTADLHQYCRLRLLLAARGAAVLSSKTVQYGVHVHRPWGRGSRRNAGVRFLVRGPSAHASVNRP